MTDTISTRARIGVRRLAGHIGAEITGVDAGTELGDDTIAQGPAGPAGPQGGFPA